MYYKNELDMMPGIYKCHGDLKYLRFKVRLECVKSSMIPLSNVEEQEVGLDPQYNEREEFEFSWNEKIFNAAEFKLYSEPQNCHTPVEKEYHEEIMKLKSSGTASPSNRLFTYTSNDKVPKTLYRNIYYREDDLQSYIDEDDLSISLRQSNNPEKPIECVSLPVKNIVDFNPSDELKKRNRSLFSGYETMHIAADLSDKITSSETSSKECEHLLVTMKWNKSARTLTIAPDFANFNTAGYKIDVDALTDTRYVYRYWIVNVSQSEEVTSLGKIDKLSAELSHYQPPLNFSLEFEVPYKDFLNIFVFAEIQKAAKFECDNLFVRYYVYLPEAWTVDNPETLSGSTQQCKLNSKKSIAQLSYLFEMKLSLIVSELEKDDLDSLTRFKVPHLFFEVCSLDSWKRFRVEGYTWAPLPTVPGRHKITLSSWRPAPLCRRDELKRFFIGSDRELSDFTYLSVPCNFDSTLLSKYGFETISSGNIHIELNIVHQIGKSIPPKKVSHLMDKAKAVLLMNSVNHILEAFKKARERMLIAREPLSLQTD
ncbi:tectonic-like complex member MKS1 [Planococcus citri]|uniref:tectonic-like complex member MKS1 n=1 Tax=Planococcus citri TaxID=170843 RepID=UPI0031F91494